MLNALIGFGGFTVVLTLIGVIGYINADRLESWAKDKFRKDRPAN